ncbi:unnamed protein product [Schistosoma bovis]|nr:unnamed protein product [Schistosoma bovis]
MNANLLHLLLAIVFTASITDNLAHRNGHFDRPADESDTNTGINDLHDPGDISDISSGKRMLTECLDHMVSTFF